MSLYRTLTHIKLATASGLFCTLLDSFSELISQNPTLYTCLVMVRWEVFFSTEKRPRTSSWVLGRSKRPTFPAKCPVSKVDGADPLRTIFGQRPA